MKRFLFGTLILLTLLVIAAVIIPFLIPKEVYKQQVQAATTKALDREVTLAGDVHLSIFPTISVGVDGLTIANAEGFDGDYLIKAGELRASVRLIPLLSRKVEVATVSFVDADVNLIRKADGSVNWEIGSSETPTEDGSQPASFDAGIDRARLVNSSLTYRDEGENLLYSISQVNASASMKGLDQPFRGDIDGLFQDQSFEGRFAIDRPRALLEDDTTDLDAKFGIANASVAYNGSVAFGDVPVLQGALEADANRLTALTSLLQVEISGADLINEVKLTADVSGTADNLALSNIQFSHRGDTFNASYRGSAKLVGELAEFDGQMSFDTDKLKTITDALALEIDGVELLEEVKLAATANGRTSLSQESPELSVSLTDIDASHKGRMFNASYKGDGGLVGEASRFDGAFSFESSQVKEIADRLAIEVEGADLLEQVKVSGRVRGTTNGDALNASLSGVDASHQGSFFNATYKGAAGLVGEQNTFDGVFSFESDRIAEISDRMALEIDGAELLGAVDLSGSVKGSADAKGAGDLEVNQFKASHRGTAFNASYDGNVRMDGETPVLDGAFDFSTEDLARLASAFKVEADGVEAAEAVSVRGTVSGTPEALSLSGLNARTDGRLLTASFVGDVSTAGAGRINGDLSASSDDLRGLMRATNVEMAPGETLRTFDIAGTTSGTMEQMKIALTRARLDDMTATGDIEIDTRGKRPVAVVTASTNKLDLTPFMKADPNAPVQRGWTKDRLPLESLSLVDSRFNLSVDRLVMDKTVLTDAKLNGNLTDGNLEVRMPDFKTFGGRWNGTFDLVTSTSTPTMTMNFTGNSIQVENLVKTFTGVDRISGAGAFQFRATARGETLYDLANSLNGNMSTNMGEGIIRGFNAAQLLRSRENIVGALASGNFNLGIGPSAETDFTSMTSIMTIQNGVGRFDTLEMLNPFLKINGLGSIDFGEQQIDINLKFAGDIAGQGSNQELKIAGIGIPLQIKGYWLSPSIGPDVGALQSQIASSVLDRVAPGLGGAAGEDGAGLIRGILGGGQLPVPGQQRQTPSPTQPGQQPAGQTPANQKKPQPKKPEDPAEQLVNDIARQALGGIFGPRRAPEEKKKDEDKDKP